MGRPLKPCALNAYIEQGALTNGGTIPSYNDHLPEFLVLFRRTLRQTANCLNSDIICVQQNVVNITELVVKYFY